MDTGTQDSWLELNDEEDALLNEAICMGRSDLEKADEPKKDTSVPKEERDSHNGDPRSNTTGNAQTAQHFENADNTGGYLENFKRNQNPLKREFPGNKQYNAEGSQGKFSTENSPTYEERNNTGIEFENNVRNLPENAQMRKRTKRNNSYYEDTKVSRSRRNSDSSTTTNSSDSSRRRVEYETDPAVLARRQKDIDYGKNTIGYDRYVQAVPKDKRTKDNPRTPPKYIKYSRRGWDGMVKLWRKQLHHWDPKDSD